jgi:hypothetical protein
MSESELYEESVTTQSASVTTVPVQANKKRKTDDNDFSSRRISQENLSRFKVLKKLNIQLTRTEHHVQYLEKCVINKSTPRSLRVNLTPQVPVINSVLQIKWEEAHINFGLQLTKILLEYWNTRKSQLVEEIREVEKHLKDTTSTDEVDLIADIISKIVLSVRKDLGNKKSTQDPEKSSKQNTRQ